MAIPYAAEGFSQSTVSLSMPQTKARTLRSRVSMASISSVVQKVSTTSKQARPSSSQGRYVKQDGPFRLVLKAERSANGQPVYSNGEWINGSLELPDESSLRAIELKLTGRIKIQEIAASGSSDTELFSHTIYEWDHTIDPRTPRVVPVNCMVPHSYIEEDTGLQHATPPSYKARLGGIPGFKVRISYEITATVTRARKTASLWRKTSRVHMPFVYRPRHLLGNFPSHLLRPAASLPDLRTQKVFHHVVRPRSPILDPIEARLYLPFGQICILDEPIPFVIKVFGNDDVLDGFAAPRPSVSDAAFSSFLPISSSPQSGRFSSSSSRPSVKPQQSKYQVKLELTRTTNVNARSSGLVAMDVDSYMTGLTTITEGIIQSTTRGPDWVAWSGQIIIPPEITSGGFSATHLNVTDELLLMIEPTSGTVKSAAYPPFCGPTPVKLTPRPQRPSSPTSMREYPSPLPSPSFSQMGFPSSISSSSSLSSNSSSGWPERKDSFPGARAY